MKFTKMHGLGNDFVVINTLTESVALDKATIKKLSDRHCGIGFDQLLLIGPSITADFSCRIFNADGSEAEQCGNGMRCVARFIHDEKLSPNNQISIETKAGIVQATIHGDDIVEVTMGKPIFNPNHLHHQLTIDGVVMDMALVSMGNPHAIIQVPSLDSYPIVEQGALISTHPDFPNGINVGFMEIINRDHIKLKTYERGSGLTYACGSNACAAVAAGIQEDKLNHSVTVTLPLGNLVITWANKNSAIIMQGPANRIFEGIISPKISN